MKKIASLFLCVAVIATMFTTHDVSAATADDNLWTDYAQEIIPNKEGVYEISTPEQLAWVALKTNSEAKWTVKKKFVLTKDIDLGLHQWVPIGKMNGNVSNEDNAFKAYFDGQNHTISNLTITGEVENEVHATYGLFGSLNSVNIKDDTNEAMGMSAVSSVKNLNLKDVNIDITASEENTEKYPAHVGAIAGFGFGNIINSSVTGTITTKNIRAVGGIVGFNYFPITNTMSNVKIDATNAYFIGGIAGDNAYYATMTNCASLGNITTTSSNEYYLGGLAGNTFDRIQNSYSTSAIQATGAEAVVGKLVGKVVNDNDGSNLGQVIDCYAASDINPDIDMIGTTNTNAPDVISVEEKTMDEMKTKGFSDLLNSLATSATLGGDKLISKEISDIFPQVLSCWKNEEGQFPQISMEVGESTGGSSQIIANATIPEPSYTVTIPTSIDFGEQSQALEKYKEETNDQYGNPIIVSKPFSVKAEGVDNLFDDLGKAPRIDVRVDFSGSMKGTKNQSATIPYTVKKGDTEFTSGSVFSSFKNTSELTEGETNTANGSVLINRSLIRTADSFKGIMTFTIGIPTI